MKTHFIDLNWQYGREKLNDLLIDVDVKIFYEGEKLIRRISEDRELWGVVWRIAGTYDEMHEVIGILDLDPGQIEVW